MSGRTVSTTVTYLALHAPPARLPPAPAAPRMALMRAEDIPLHFYRYLYDRVGAACLWVERLGLSDEALAAMVQRAGIEITVLYASGAPAGYYELDFADAERPNLVYFGLMPEWIGRGMGAWLLGTAISEVFVRGAAEMTVNTCTLDHPAALPLYQRLGFQPVRREERNLIVPDGLSIPSHIDASIAP